MISGRLQPVRADVVVFSSACVYVVLLAYATTVWDYDIWGGLVVAPVLVGVTLPIMQRVADKDGLPGLYPLLVTALVVKLVMSVPRWAVAFVLYDGSADAASYDGSGRKLLPLYRHLVFPLSDQAGSLGTKVLASITGGVYAVIGPTIIGGFLVFSWIGFLGLVACFRAARIALPPLDGHRYAALLFFLPSMIFWPSSIGKEAVITLSIGLTLLGAARCFTSHRRGIVLVGVGLALTFALRPHIAALLAGSFAVALISRPTTGRTAITPVLKTISVLVVGVIAFWVTLRAAQSLGIDSADGATSELNKRGELTATGGSSFKAAPIRGPRDVLPSALAVFFRPFPWEATSAQVLLASLESTALLALLVVSWRRVVTGLAGLRNPFLFMNLLYLLGFLYAFSRFGNFGILARQRVQALPMLLLFIALIPLPRRPRKPGTFIDVVTTPPTRSSTL